MGDPKKARKKYRTPGHPWQKARLEEEDGLAKEYGIKNKKEIWKMNTILSSFTNQSKKLVTLLTKQAEQDKLNLLKKLKKMGLLNESQDFDDILNLVVKDIMERRLQTLVHRKGLAKTMTQARQMIVHSHIMVGDKKIESPSYLVDVAEEPKIKFVGKSPFASEDHPERKVKEEMPKKPKAKESEEASKKDEKKSESKKGSKNDVKKADKKEADKKEADKKEAEKPAEKKEVKEEKKE
jgi:small subunit ribosomal protein S4